MFFSTLSFYDNFAENVVIFVVMSLAFFQPKYLKCGGGIFGRFCCEKEMVLFFKVWNKSCDL